MNPSASTGLGGVLSAGESEGGCLYGRGEPETSKSRITTESEGGNN